jgi:hydrogenase maturation protein HypF
VTAVAPPGGAVRHRVRVTGVVQGVGFRPFVHRLATDLGLAGQVGNDAAGVLVDVEGGEAAVTTFESRLAAEAPALAHVEAVEVVALPLTGQQGFRIAASAATGGRTFVSPDVATCDDCLAELRDPGDRRHRYPFVNCTNCGPRFTITERLPYDRPHTTMRDFAMCAACAAEYRDPADRRFHAQPVACPACGPRLAFDGPGGEVAGTEAALAAARAVLAGGGIVAVKGLGGYHLACDATSDRAVGELRRRKHRPGKPLAVMVASLDHAAALGDVGAAEAGALTGPARPVVLLRRRAGARLSDLVAPGSPHVGVMLPYAPLHHLLLDPPTPLVMTSGNRSEEPICFDDADARRRLAGITDAWLTHDRPIHVPCDDSVVRITTTGELPLRRSRGHAPLPFRLPFPVPPLLAVGAELKNTFCLAAGRDAWLSQHIGDMGTVETLDAFERSTCQFTTLYGVTPEHLAADAHPGYHTRRWAERPGRPPVVLVQHHHAHVAAVMVEHGLGPDEQVIGMAFDGTGYGPDGTIWGGEVLVGGYGGCDRASQLRAVPLPGGDGAIRAPYRAALAHLRAAGVAWTPDLPPVAAAPAVELPLLGRQLDTGYRCVPTSSMGRLWDAVASIAGVRHTVSFEAQAAMELEALGESWLASGSPVPPYVIADAGPELDPRPLVVAAARDAASGVPPGAIAAGFHLAVAHLVAAVATRLASSHGLGRVALAGGVWQNALLDRLVHEALEGSGLEVLAARRVPPNDGGLALGQAAVAGWASLAGGSAGGTAGGLVGGRVGGSVGGEEAP